jgi:cell fate regulator YaaT (PSP1 superfamily)
MIVAEVQFAPWDKAYWFLAEGHNLILGDKVVVRTDLGVELGMVIGFQEVTKPEKEIKDILRKANFSDLEQAKERGKRKIEALAVAKKMAAEANLDLKIVDVHYSFDGGRITFAFIADSRLDFRDYVKALTHHFQKSIRLHQIGVRDEAKLAGNFGPCGEHLCCQRFLRELGQVSADCIEAQQIAHRGSERLSGMCGRLKCCLRFEYDGYCALAKNLPALGTRVRTDHGRGEIIGWHILRQSVKVRLDAKNGEEPTVVEVAIKK